VNVGGDPERDDFGLPPVDIEIPDDARDLDRDVQAYHRELRALRRRRRVRRLHRPLTRDGMVLPLLAGCLVLALISGTLLTLFSAGQADVPGLPGQVAARPAASGTASGTASAVPPAVTAPAGTPAAAGQGVGPLPASPVVIAGQTRQLGSLSLAVLALVPAGCQCTAALRDLVKQAATARVPLYLVAAGTGFRQLSRLAARARWRTALVADDVHNVLGPAYQPRGLTAILVRADGSVALVRRGLRAGLRLSRDLSLLALSGRPAGA
jgi:hypothetical protein